MQRIFGLPIQSLVLTLVVLVGASVALITALALRHRVFFRLGIRNAKRRPGRSALIVVGLMLATAIIAAALGTGDTMGRNVRASVLQSLGTSDEWITVKGAKPDATGSLAAGTGLAPFDQSVVQPIDAALAGSGLTDGVLPAIVQPIAVQDETSRQTEPRVTLFAPDPSRLHGFGTIRDDRGRAVDLAALAPGRVLLDHHAADALGAHAGDTIAVLAGSTVLRVEVAAIVQYRGAGTAKAAMIVPLAHVQAALHVPGKVEQILVSNRGNETSGVARTDAVIARLRTTLARHGLEAQDLKRDGLQRADDAGSSFMTMFSTFGTFSIAAGILLIFLIFVMLAAERRTEMGVARAIGTQRRHLVEMFLFEGAAYDLVAAAVGALLGIAVSFVMVLGIASAFASTNIDITYSVRWQSVVVAYTLGVLLTFVVVALSAWRVSVLNIVTAVRNLPDPTRRLRRRRGLLGAAAFLLLGALLIVSGRSGGQAMPFMLGVSLVFVGLVPVLRAASVPERLAYTLAGLGIVAVWLMPFRVLEQVVPGAKMDFSMWVVGGLLIVLGATWAVVYSADALLGAGMAVLGRIRSLSAVLRISMAYPLRTRLRTGMTLAMFTLVVFTLVVGITTPNSFIASASNVPRFGGGFDVRAMTTPAGAVADMQHAVQRQLGRHAADVRVVASISNVPVQARQDGAGTKYADYALRGYDDAFLTQNHYALGSRATGYTSDRQVWDALAAGGNVAVVDPWIVPHRRNWTFGALSDMTLHGFFAEDATFTPVTVDVRDPETDRVTRFTVIGVLRDSMPFEMAGIATGQRALGAFGSRATPTMHLFALAPGTDPDRFAQRLESAFLANGLQADSFRKLVDDAQAASMMFLRLIEGFMALGLVVGVAALGVIAARSVVERRQQIGVLRAIGFQARAVRLGFLLESGFLALTSIVVGTALGLLMSYNVIDDARRQATWPDVRMIVPWLNLSAIFATVLLVALVTTYLPARRASRVYPAEALRYE